MCQKLSKVIALVTALTFLVVLLQYQHQTSGRRNYNGFRRHLRPQKTLFRKTKYLINNLVCSSEGGHGHDNEIRLIIIITSHPGDTKIRNKLRQMIPPQNLHSMKMRRLFLLGILGPQQPDSASKYSWVSFQEIQEESKTHSDILLGDFLESYHNLTYKHIMGLEWVGRYCPQAQLLLKQDDDIIVDLYQLDHLLTLPPFSTTIKSNNGRNILGKVLDHQPVLRDPNSKWFVTRDEYGPDIFPPFVSGWTYITTPKVAQLLAKTAEKLDYFWIDDVHITGTLREAAGVQLLDFSNYFTTFKGQLQCCVATPQSTKREQMLQPYWCDYIVGPPNDDLTLMELFHAHARFCHTTNLCARRTGTLKLERSCVITPHMVVNKFNISNYRASSNGTIKSSWKPLEHMNKVL